jgi:hypothetical protein
MKELCEKFVSVFLVNAKIEKKDQRIRFHDKTLCFYFCKSFLQLSKVLKDVTLNDGREVPALSKAF